LINRAGWSRSRAAAARLSERLSSASLPFPSVLSLCGLVIGTIDYALSSSINLRPGYRSLNFNYQASGGTAAVCFLAFLPKLNSALI